MKTHTGIHYFDDCNQEFVDIDGGGTYRIDRTNERLVNVANPTDVLVLAQRQYDGDGEILERYEALDDPYRSVVIDSSSDWLESLKSS